MSRRDIIYTSLLVDEGFRDMNLHKFRRLMGMGLAEMIGVAVYMFLGCGNVVSTITGSEPTHAGTVISFAFGISTAVVIVNHISGSILNPALTMAAVILGHVSIPKMIFYTIFQLLGAILGVGILKVLVPDLPDGFCCTKPNPDLTTAAAFTAEVVCSFILALTFCAILDAKNNAQHNLIFLKFGLAIIAIALPAGKFSGCSMNPARSFGPALLFNEWTDHWMFWVGPYGTACVTAILYRLLWDETLLKGMDKRADQPI